MHSDSTGPVQTDKRPGQRRSQHGNVRQARRLRVLEVGECQVEEIDDLEEQGPAEVGAAPEVDEAELEEVVVGEGCCEVRGCG